MACCRPLALLLGGGKLPHGAELPMLLAHTSVFFYSVAYEMSVVAIPFMNKAVKGNSSTFATLKVAFALFQLVGGILFGRFGDLFSGRSAMMVAHVASALSYALMGASTSIMGVFISMVPTVLQHGYQAAQMIVADVTVHGVERSAALSLIGLGYGLGAIFGPMLAGELDERLGPRMTCALAAGLEVLVVLTLFLALPATRDRNRSSILNEDSLDGHDARKSDVAQSGSVSFSLFEFHRVLVYPGVLTLLGLHLGQQLSWTILSSMLAQFALDVYDMDAKELGVVLSAQGMASLITRPLLASILPAVGERGCMLFSSVMACSSLALVFLFSAKWALFQVMLVGSIWSSVMYAVVPGLVTQLVPIDDTGTALGLDMATGSLAGLVCPLISNAIYMHSGFRAVAATALFGTFITFLCACICPLPKTQHLEEASTDENSGCNLPAE